MPSRDEARTVLNQPVGELRLMGLLLYSAALRLLECAAAREGRGFRLEPDRRARR